MSVTKEDVWKVARLARIRIEDSEIEEIQGSLNEILSFVEQLKKVDCSQIEDSVRYMDNLHERKDVAFPCDLAIMDNAPHKEYNMFVIPKVVGQIT